MVDVVNVEGRVENVTVFSQSLEELGGKSEH